MRTRRLIGLVAVLAFSQFIAAGKTPAQREAPKAKGKAATGEGQRAKDFIAAFNKGDVKVKRSGGGLGELDTWMTRRCCSCKESWCGNREAVCPSGPMPS